MQIVTSCTHFSAVLILHNPPLCLCVNTYSLFKKSPNDGYLGCLKFGVVFFFLFLPLQAMLQWITQVYVIPYFYRCIFEWIPRNRMRNFPRTRHDFLHGGCAISLQQCVRGFQLDDCCHQQSVLWGAWICTWHIKNDASVAFKHRRESKRTCGMVAVTTSGGRSLSRACTKSKV